MTKKKTAIMFDMDGVLLDTPKINWDAYGIILKRHNIDLTQKEIKNMLGLSLEEQVNILNQNHGLDLEYESFWEEAQKLREQNITSYADITHEGIQDFLKLLKQKQTPVAVVTSATKEIANMQLKQSGLFKYFDAVVTRDDTKERKPSPAPYLKGAEKIGVPPENCYVIEDSQIGIESAHNAGMTVAGLVTEFNTEKDLQEADIVIDRFSEFPNIE